MDDTVIFSRTRTGTLALNDATTVLSPGFRRLLKLIDGRRNVRDLLAEMPQLDAEDLHMWIGELLRGGMVAADGDVSTGELSFSLSGELPPVGMHPAADEHDLMASIMADLSFSIDPDADAPARDRLNESARMAVVESGSVIDYMEQTRFFVQPDAAEGLPGRLRVCIAGHSRPQNHLLGLILKRAGVAAEIAPARESLVAMLEREPRPHLLLIDGEMPQLDTYEALKAVKQAENLKEVRMVIISERDRRTDLAKAMMLGAAGYLVKPLRKAVIDVAMPQIIGRRLS